MGAPDIAAAIFTVLLVLVGVAIVILQLWARQ